MKANGLMGAHGCDLSPHSIMMAVIANMILDKDPEFEALIAEKVSQFITAFEQEDDFYSCRE